MGFEPTTSCLGSKHSTPELRPLKARIIANELRAVVVVGLCLSRGLEARRELRQQISGLGRPQLLSATSHGR